MDEKQARRECELVKKRHPQDAEILKWARWRWEFMRHNRKIRAAWKAVLKLRACAKYPPGTIQQDGNMVVDLYCSTPECSKEIELKRRLGIPFGIGLFPDPDKSFDEIVRAPGRQFSTVCNVPGRAVSFSANYPEEHKVKIEIDFQKVNSIEDLKRYICHHIDEHHNRLEKNNRTNKTDYDKILAIGKLKRQGLTGSQIANKIFKDKDPANAERKVNQLAMKYRELVDGGYLKLTFP